MSDSLQPQGLYSPWNSPGQSTGVGSLSRLQGIFPTQGATIANYVVQRSLELFNLVELKGDFKILVHGDFVFLFWSQLEACGILVLQPGIEPAPPAVEGKVLTTG